MTDLPCHFCGETHGRLCPMVKALEYDPQTGAITRVEFLTAADFPRPREEAETGEATPPYTTIQKAVGGKS